MAPKKNRTVIYNAHGSVKKKPTKNQKYKDEAKRLKARDTIQTDDGPKNMG